ncbi:tyrosine-type recombinase/integrase [Caballeronia sp. KNU42]
MPALTELGLKAIKSDSDGLSLADGEGLTGVVRVGTAGRISVSFAYAYRFNGARREISCGSWPKKSLKTIRKARNDARALLDSGDDPAERKKIEKLEKRVATKAKVSKLEDQLDRPTVSMLFKQWEKAVLTGRKDGGLETSRSVRKDVLPALGSRFAADIKKADLMAVLDIVKARGAPMLANRLLAECKQMFNFALDREIVTVNPAASITKAKVGGKDTIRTRVLSEKDIRALPAVLAASGLMTATQHIIWTLLATSARIGELCSARRIDIDIDAGTWRIPAENAKNKHEHMVYLSAFAVEHMKALLDCSTSNEWLLSAANGKNHLGPKGITKQIADRQLKFYNRTAHSGRSTDENSLVIGHEKWGPHDLRRSSATLMQKLGILPPVIEACLNHVEPNRMKRVYQHHDYEVEQREAWTALGQKLKALTTNNVLTMPGVANQ